MVCGQNPKVIRRRIIEDIFITNIHKSDANELIRNAARNIKPRHFFIGEPMATSTISVEDFNKLNYVGIYESIVCEEENLKRKSAK